jgi:N-acetylneuraminic acid mutarotase
VICIGGSDSQRHYAEVFSLSWSRGKIHTTDLPSLPKPCANMCGAILGNKIYIAGGLENPDSTNALKIFWSFNLKKPEAGWRELEPWPGPERMLAVAGAMNGKFYIFGGADLKKGVDGKLVREWLRDAYCFTPGKGWKRIADLPRAAVAAPSPAPILDNSLLVLGGDDGSQVDTPPTEHRGFPHDILAYEIKTDSWKKIGEMPFALVTTPSANLNERIIIPGGEARPGIRSANVWAGLPIRLH